MLDQKGMVILALSCINQRELKSIFLWKNNGFVLRIQAYRNIYLQKVLTKSIIIMCYAVHRYHIQGNNQRNDIFIRKEHLEWD